MNRIHRRAGLGLLLAGNLLAAACSSGGGNDGAAASPGPTALTAAQLIGSSWRLDNDACPNHRTIEFRADAIVTPAQTIRVTYRQDTAPSVLLATPEGGGPESRMRFSLSGERLTMFNPENGMPCVFVRA